MPYRNHVARMLVTHCKYVINEKGTTGRLVEKYTFEAFKFKLRNQRTGAFGGDL